MAANSRSRPLRFAFGAACLAAVRGVRNAPSPRLRSTGLAALQADVQHGIQMPSESVDFTEPTSPPLALAGVSPDAEKSMKAAARSGVVRVAAAMDIRSGRFALHRADSVVEDPNQIVVAWAHYNNSFNTTGWAYLSVNATDDVRVSREAKMYAAGLVEGAVSLQQIQDFKHNADILLQGEEGRHHALNNIRDLFNHSAHLILAQSNMSLGAKLSDGTVPADPWWKHARYGLLQVWGILDAYNHRVAKGKSMSLVDLLILNSDGETPELETAYDMEEFLLRQSKTEPDSPDDDDSTPPANASGAQSLIQRRHTHHPLSAARKAQLAAKLRRATEMRQMDDAHWRRIKESTGRCSALVRLTSNNTDLMVGHTTFSDFGEMNRIFKYYDLPLGHDSVRRMGFSSYPGVAGSTDDYYLMDSGLVVTETTISMLTDEPYDKLNDNVTSLPDFMRIMMANRLAKSGVEWADLMKKSASGTYSSQWMVVDYNTFVPGKPLNNGTLVVLEQAPGISHAEDMSGRLQQTGFWASENRAWYKDVRDAVGMSDATDLHGDLFSADRNPRATIFAATAPKVQSLYDMRREMRRNRWPYDIDGGAGNTPDHAIAARGDLDKKDANPNGAVDAKVTNRCMAKKLQCNAISGPTADTQAPFRWTDANGKELYPDMPHQGQPNLWNFDWVRMGPEGSSDSVDEC